MSAFRDELEELETAEDFLGHFGIAFDPRVVNVNRLHILQRFHDYLGREDGLDAAADEVRRARYRDLLGRSYRDFVESDAITEKVFRVHRDQAAHLSDRFVPLASLMVHSDGGFAVSGAPAPVGDPPVQNAARQGV